MQQSLSLSSSQLKLRIATDTSTAIKKDFQYGRRAVEYETILLCPGRIPRLFLNKDQQVSPTESSELDSSAPEKPR